jgi:hypothetical protein
MPGIKFFQPIFLDGQRRCTRDDPPASLNEHGLIPIVQGYTIKEMAWMFGVTWCTMQKWLKRGWIPSVRMLGTVHQNQPYRVLHRALMRWIAENPGYEYVLDKLDGDLDMFEPTTLHGKKQEILRAIARSPREQAPAHRTPAQQEPKLTRAWQRRKATREALDDVWPW